MKNKNIYFLILFFLIINIFAKKFDPHYFKKKADEYKIQKKYISAIEYYKKSIQKNKNFIPALLNLGIVLRKIGKYKESLFWLKKANQINTQDITIKFELILTLIKDSQLNKAKNITLYELKKNSFNYRYKYLISIIYIKEKRYYLARKILKQIIRSNPGFFKAYISLGDLYLIQKDYYTAQKYYNKAKLIHPENPNILVYLAKIELAKIFEKKELFDSFNFNFQIFEKPLTILLNSKKYDNYLKEANLIIGKIYALNKKCDESISYFNTILYLNPEHSNANYYLGYCDIKKSIKIYPQILSTNSNNEIVRFFYEKNLIQILNRRENPLIMQQVRYHYNRGRNLLKSNFQKKALNEIRWSQYLYPKFKKSHISLLNHYRLKKDFLNIKKELQFLRKNFSSIKYDDLFEQYLRYRNNSLSYKEGFKNINNYKNKIPIFLFYLKPNNNLTNYPNAGRAIIEKTIIELNQYGKITTFNNKLRKKLYNKLLSQNYFGEGGYYTSIVGNLIQKQVNQYQYLNPIKLGEDNNFIIRKRQLKYILGGVFNAQDNKMSIDIFIKDINSGKIIKSKKFSASGQGFLTSLTIQLATFIYKSIPFESNVIKINNSNIVINSGKRDGIVKNQILKIVRNNRTISLIKIKEIDFDLSIAKPQNKQDIFKIRIGDKVFIKKNN